LDARDYVVVRLHDEYYDKGGEVGGHRLHCVTHTAAFATPTPDFGAVRHLPDAATCPSGGRCESRGTPPGIHLKDPPMYRIIMSTSAAFAFGLSIISNLR